jgi:CheY-like chemotaxis protein
VLLVVEDDEATRAVLEEALGAREVSGLAPLRVVAVGDAQAAWRAVAEQPPHLVILDLKLPGESGFALCRRLRADPRCRGTRIVVLSAHPAAEAEREAVAAGCDAFVAKPFQLDELLAVVRRWFGAAQAHDV